MAAIGCCIFFFGATFRRRKEANISNPRETLPLARSGWSEDDDSDDAKIGTPIEKIDARIVKEPLARGDAYKFILATDGLPAVRCPVGPSCDHRGSEREQV
jgi:hypothetical protein